jgi:hypothetical protein
MPIRHASYTGADQCESTSYRVRVARIFGRRGLSLTEAPEETIGRLYDAVGEPRFAHDFSNAEYDEPHYDLNLGCRVSIRCRTWFGSTSERRSFRRTSLSCAKSASGICRARILVAYGSLASVCLTFKGLLATLG